MPRKPESLIFVGIRNTVLALDPRTGEAVWTMALRSSEFTSVMWDGEALVATSAGEVYRLDPATGEVVWHNTLKGLGRGLVSLASSRVPSGGDATLAMERKRQEVAADASVAM